MFHSYSHLLRTYLGPLQSQVVVLTLLLFGGVALQLLNPQIVRLFIDTARAGGEPRVLALAGAAFLAAAIGQQIVSLSETYVARNVGWRATNALRADLVAHCLGLDLTFHNARTPGELIERVDGDVSTLGGFFSRFVVVVAGNFLLLAGILLLVLREDWRIGLLYLAVGLGKFGFSVWSRGIGARYAGAQRQASAELFGFLEERLHALPDVKANGAQAYVLYRAQLALRTLFHRAQRAIAVDQLLFTGRFFIDTAGWLATFAAVAFLFARGEMTLGTAYLLIQYRTMVNRPLSQIMRQMQDFQQASASIQRILELLGTSRHIVDRGSLTLPRGPLSVEFDGVSFRYPGAAADAVDDVSFAVPAGRSLGVLGRTGSGKTTQGRLLCRLYDVSTGTVRAGGVDVRALSRESLGRRIGLVTQEVQLFRATVRENLTLFDPAIPDARLGDVLESLGLGPWLRALPAGLDTPLGTAGVGLSAGEAQLLAFARLFLRHPGIVVLDEASSRLDPATERLIDRAVAGLLGDGERTAIVIAHRLETVQRTDDVLILEAGAVAEYGPRARLAADPTSRFAALLRSGALESAPGGQTARATNGVEVPA